MGNVRTEQIKRVAKELIRRFPNRFSNNFDENKRAVDTLVLGATTKVRNQIAGYITHAFAGAQTASPSSETSEEEEEE
ncbi:30S ribosomal protein S17e [Candidatus Bathyarchaeota archaeon A05DMB-5]|nr:30S ribosomal protein S17e [Candidatus Bathyarchaeota archaeon A05DMB-5]